VARAHLLALLCMFAVACGGDTRRASSSSGGGAIGADGNGIDGARHSSFDDEGDAVGTADVTRGSGDVIGNQDLPNGPDVQTADGEGVGQTDDLGTDGPTCTPECAGKICGDDGCGGSCGVCPVDFPFCLSGSCSNCEADCDGLSCGSNGCGGSCGSCGASEICVTGACVCEPSCPQESCGEDDGCGGLCPGCEGLDVTDASSDGAASDVPGEGQDTQTDASVGPDADGSPSDSSEADSSDTVDGGSDAGSNADVDGGSDAGSSADVDGGSDAGSSADAASDVSDDGSSDVLEEVSADGGVVDPDAPGGGDVSGGDVSGGDVSSDSGAQDSAPPQEDLGPPIEAPTAGEFVITEVMRAPLDGQGTGRQWFEIVSVVDGARALDGCTFTDALGAALVVEVGQALLAYQRLVFAQDGADEDGLLGADVLYPTIADGGPDLSPVGVLSFECATVVIDAIDLTVVAGDSAFPDETGRAMQLDVGATNATANDSPGAWCSSYKLYGAAGYGSPGVGNHPCDSDVDWCRIWSPGFKLAKVGELWEVTTHLHEEGLTTLTSNAPDDSPTLKAQAGYGIDGSLPAEVPEQWTWFTAVAVEDPPAAVPAAADRYVAVVTMTSAGIYDVAGRFSLDDGFTWTYCDLDGSANGYSKSSTGHATIIP
jgi:hypothetical protein